MEPDDDRSHEFTQIGVCLACICYTAACGLPLPSQTAATLLTIYPVPNYKESNRGNPFSFSPLKTPRVNKGKKSIVRGEWVKEKESQYSSLTYPRSHKHSKAALGPLPPLLKSRPHSLPPRALTLLLTASSIQPPSLPETQAQSLWRSLATTSSLPAP